MGWGSKIRHGLGKAKHKAEDTAKNAGKAVEKTAGAAVDAVTDTAEQLAEKTMSNAIEKLGGEIKSGVKKVGGEVEQGVRKVGHEAEDRIKALVETAKKEIRKEADEARRSIRDHLAGAVKEFKEQAMEALKAIGKGLASGIFRKFLKILKIGSPSGVSFDIGPVNIAFDNVRDRLGTLEEWARNPPTSKRCIRRAIETAAPTSIAISASANVALVLVASKELGVGGQARWDTQDFLDNMDAILDEFGIPGIPSEST